MLTITIVNTEAQYQYCNAWYKRHAGAGLAEGLAPQATPRDIRRGLLLKSPVVMAVAAIDDQIWAIAAYRVTTGDASYFVLREFPDCDIRLALQFFIDCYLSIADRHLVLFECKNHDKKKDLVESFFCKGIETMPIDLDFIYRENHVFVLATFNAMKGLAYAPLKELVSPRGDRTSDITVCVNCEGKKTNELADCALYYAALSHFALVGGAVTTERIREEMQEALDALDALVEEAIGDNDEDPALADRIRSAWTCQWHDAVYTGAIDSYIRQKRTNRDEIIARLRDKTTGCSKELGDILTREGGRVARQATIPRHPPSAANTAVSKRLVHRLASAWASLAISIVESDGKFDFIPPRGFSATEDTDPQKIEPRITNHGRLIGKVITPGLIKNAPYDERVLRRALVYSHPLPSERRAD